MGTKIIKKIELIAVAGEIEEIKSDKPENEENFVENNRDGEITENELDERGNLRSDTESGEKPQG
jgi:hypothetical protein